MANGIQIRQSFVLNIPAGEAYGCWRRFENFPRFMNHVRSVEAIDEKRSRWVVAGPAGKDVTWEAEIVEDLPGSVIAWRTIGESDIRHGGRVTFDRATGDRGTVISIQMSYEPPMGAAGPALAKIFGEDPEAQIRQGLRRFKQLAETGEIATIEGQSSGRADEVPAAADSSVGPAILRKPGRRGQAAPRGEVTP